MNRLAVLGRPVSHSLSPRMHRAAFAAVGIERDWSYEAVEVAPERFEQTVRGMVDAGWRGANVTVPHKERALELADEASARAREIGAANTLSFSAGRISADNTDAPGLVAALGPERVEGRTALVLGAGGAGRAAVWGLREAGAEVGIWNRTVERSSRLAAEMDVDLVRSEAEIDAFGFDLLVNATSAGLGPGAGLGAAPQRAAARTETASREAGRKLTVLPVLADCLGDRHLVVDLVYGKEETELIRLAGQRGARTVDGVEVLIRQGAESFRVWTGMEPPIESMRTELTG